MACEFYGRGKLLLSGEYLVLDGAEALALGLQVGQWMRVEDVPGDGLEWESTEKDGSVWFSARFAADGILQEASNVAVAARLKRLLAVCREENPRFDFSGKRVCLHAEFDRSWGLGSSSTLIYTLAQWAQVDPFALVRRAWPGSGYDVACAGIRQGNALLYRLEQGIPRWEEVVFRPPFARRLYFVYSGAKQDTASAVAAYRQLPADRRQEAAGQVTRMARQMLSCRTLGDFEILVEQHERLVGNLLGVEPVGRRCFADYQGGVVKSLGAWGGDFLLVTGECAPEYFQGKGFRIVLPFNTIATK